MLGLPRSFGVRPPERRPALCTEDREFQARGSGPEWTAVPLLEQPCPMRPLLASHRAAGSGLQGSGGPAGP